MWDTASLTRVPQLLSQVWVSLTHTCVTTHDVSRQKRPIFTHKETRIHLSLRRETQPHAHVWHNSWSVSPKETYIHTQRDPDSLWRTRVTQLMKCLISEWLHNIRPPPKKNPHVYHACPIHCIPQTWDIVSLRHEIPHVYHSCIIHESTWIIYIIYPLPKKKKPARILFMSYCIPQTWIIHESHELFMSLMYYSWVSCIIHESHVWGIQ